jgi:hypothetical protein
MLSVAMLSVAMLSVIMLIVVILSVIMLSVVMLSVIMLSVVALAKWLLSIVDLFNDSFYKPHRGFLISARPFRQLAILSSKNGSFKKEQ